MTSAFDAKIPVVGLHAAALPGPDSNLHLWDNITSSGDEIGKALADYIIADSKGKGRAIILYDAQYAIAKLKAEAMKKEFATCSSCTLLDYVNSPLAEVTTQMPQLASSWVSRYGTPFYVMTIADYYYDFLVPPLRAGGVKPDDVKLVGADGTPKAYDRIRNGDYQVATVPEPPGLQGYQAIDEMNRALNGAQPSNFIQPVYVVTKANVDKEGGSSNLFDPSNDYKDRYAKIGAQNSASGTPGASGSFASSNAQLPASDPIHPDHLEAKTPHGFSCVTQWCGRAASRDTWPLEEV